jgi:adenylosuccinate synthase
MPNICVVGAQWGDEGKAGIVDLMAAGASWVVRFQGGSNAGHTVVVGEETFKLHLVPSGIVRKEVKCLVGQGVVVDLEVLFGEADMLEARGVRSEGRLFISDRTHLILPYHRVLDGLKESSTKRKIGTTLKGIGPCYADKVSYRGIRVADLMDPEFFRDRLAARVESVNTLIEKVYGGTPVNFEEIHETYCRYRERLAPMVADGVEVLHAAHEAGEKVLFEGAQGFLLDVDAGTYPYVTGSNASTFGLSGGAGIPPRNLDRAVGISKAYCTRVGEGPFPTEDKGAYGDLIRERGKEFGTTTGRPRRCGWFDAVAVRYAAKASGFDDLAVTKLDILSGVDPIKVAVAYDFAGRRIEAFPADLRTLQGAVPVYRDFPGFTEDITGARRFEDLPKTAQDYLKALEELIGVPIRIVSVGPEREQVILRD